VGDVGVLGVVLVNELPPKMIPIEYDEANDTPTTLGPFFLHWISLFTVILAFGFSMYHFTVPVFWKICVSTLMSALVLSMGVVVPTFYGSRRVPVPSPGEAADATAFSEKESEQDEEEHLSRKVSHGSYADSQFESQSFLGKKKSSEDEALAAALDVCFYGSSIPLSESIKTWRFWAIYFTFMTLCGTALMVIDDINLIAASLGTSPSTFFATCVSLANGLGRVTAGYMSDLLVTRFSRMQMMSCVAISMGLAQGLFAVGSTTLLYPCLLIVGYLFGCTVALIAVTVPDVFGSKFVATNFGATDSAPIFGSYIFVTGVVSIFYSSNSLDDAGGESCVGADCFRWSFIVNAIACIIVGIVMYITHLKTPIPIGRGSAH
jgi:hypothetical protein